MRFFAPLRMTGMVALRAFCVLPFAFCLPAFAQEDVANAPLKKSGVKLQFLPPPMEGTFSLGVYDAKGKLVRALHADAPASAFGAALNGLITYWDGKDDSGAQLPAGKYSARGYCVSEDVKTKREEFSLDGAAPEASPQSSPAISPAPSPDGATPAPAAETLDAVKDKLRTPDGKPFSPEEKVKLALKKNPLEQKKPGSAEVTVGFDEKGSFLKLVAGLPLKRLTETAHLKWAAIARGAEPDSLVLFQSDGAAVEEFKLSKVSKMMAFDCGEFDYDPARDK